MVAVVAGNGLGLFNASSSILGDPGTWGQSALGQAHNRLFVNAATGNLVLQAQDEQLSGRGTDLRQLRTYNALGGWNDGDADGWRLWGERALKLVSGTPGAAGSQVVRTDEDGHETTLTWNGNRYVGTEGAGAHDMLSYDSASQRWTWTEGSSRVQETYSYDAATKTGRLLEQRDVGGNRIAFGYDAAGRLTSITDTASSQQITLVYGTVGSFTRLQRVETRALVEDASGAATATLGVAIRQVSYGYDSAGRLTSVTSDLTPANTTDNVVYVTTYSYDNASDPTSHRIASLVQSDGTRVFFTYDASGRVKTVQDTSDPTTKQLEFVYGTNSTDIIDGNGRVWTYQYDVMSRQLTAILAPAAQSGGARPLTRFAYDGSGNVVTVTDPLGHVVTYTYDAAGNRTREVDALGNTVERRYDGNNQLVIETRYGVPDGDGVAGPALPSKPMSTRYVYDASSRLRYTVSAEGRVSENRYDPVSGLLQATLRYAAAGYTPAGAAETTPLALAEMDAWVSAMAPADKALIERIDYAYDLRGNLMRETRYAEASSGGQGVIATAAVTEYVYDAQGLLRQSIAARGAQHDQRTTLTSFSYDGLGRMVSSFGTDGTSTTSYLDGERKVQVSTAAGLLVTRAYDTRGRLVGMTQSGDGSTRTTRFVHDNTDLLRMTEDAAGGRSFAFYDTAGRLEFSVDATGAVVRNEYDAAGQLTAQTRFGTRVAPAAMAAWYDAATGKVTKATLAVQAGGDVVPDAAVDRLTRYEYDDAGRLLRTTDAANVVTTTVYDGLSRMVATQTGERVTRNLYDRDGRLVGIVDPLGFLTEQRYDAAGRLVETMRYAARSPAAANTSAPAWIGVANQAAIGGQLFEYRLPAVDVDGDALTVRIKPGTTLPSWLTLDTSGGWATLRGTPPTTLTGYTVTLQADDGRGRISDVSFAVTVTNVAPRWSDLADIRLPLNSDNYAVASFELPAAEDDRGGLVYSIVSPLAQGVTFDPLTRRLSADGVVQRGVFTVTARVTDAQGLSVDRSFAVIATRGDGDMQWAPVPTQPVVVGQPFSMTLPPARDAQGAAVTYAVVGSLPSWLQFTASSRELKVIGPVPSNAVYQPVQFSASSATGSQLLSFGLDVRAPAPAWATLPPMQVQAGIAATLTVPAATSAAGLALTYTVAGGLPPGFTFTASSRTLSATAAALPGYYSVTLRATDARGQSIQRVVAVQVRSNTATAPTGGGDALVDWRPVDTTALRTRHFHDASGRVVGSVDERGFLTETVYDDAARSERVLRYQTAVSLGVEDTLATLKSRAGTALQTSRTDYDTLNRVVETTAADGSTQSRNEYDAAGRLVRITDAVGTSEARARRTTYTAFGEVAATLGGEGDAWIGTSTDPQRLADAIRDYGTRSEYDALGRLARTIDANGHRTLYYYDRQGRPTLTVRVSGDATANTLAGEVTESQYNAYGEMTQARRYLARLTDSDMDLLLAAGGGGAADQLLSDNTTPAAKVAALRNDGVDEVTRHEYDRRGQLTRTTDAEGNVTSRVYDALGQLEAQTRSSGTGRTTTSQFEYDAAGRLLAQASDAGAINAVSRQVYDAYGRVLQTVDPNGRVTSTRYEDGGRTVVVTDPLGRGVRSQYDAQGRTLVVTDALGSQTRWQYDDAARTTTMTTPEGTKVVTAMTRHGQTLSITDGRGNRTQFAYDRDGHLKTTTDALGRIQASQTYDKSGRLYEVVDARGTVVRYAYDAADRVIERQVDPAGLNLRTRYEFDALGRQTRVTEAYGSADTRVTEHSYDRNSRITRTTVDPAGLKLTTDYRYDAAGQVVRVALGTTAQPSQHVTLYEYDALGRRTTEIVAPSAEFGAGAAGTRDLATRYAYDLAGRVSRRVDAGGNSSWFVYDAAGQLTQTVNALGEVTETRYDAAGRVAHTRQYLNRLPPATLATFGDRLGGPVSPAPHAYDHRAFQVYDADGRLRFTVQADIDTQWTINEHRYDANGNRIETRRYDKTLLEDRVNAMDSAASPGVSVAEVRAELATLGYDDANVATLSRIQVTRFAYDALNRLRFSVDALGSVTQTDHDAAGLVTGVVRFSTRPALSSYSEAAIETAVAPLRSASTNEQTRYAYDAAGRMAYTVRVLQPGASGKHVVTKQEYDALGRVVRSVAYAQMIGVAGFTKAELDTATSVAAVRNDAANRIEAAAYDAAGRTVYQLQVAAVDAQGVAAQHLVTRQEFDALGHVVRRTVYANATGALADYRASTIAGAVATANGRDRTVELAYDAAGRLRFGVAADGAVTETVYDAVGQVLETRAFAGRAGSDVARTEAGLAAWRASLRVGDGTTRGEVLTYDRGGRVLTSTDALGSVESSTYNGLGERISRTDRNGAVWTYGYDRAGRLYKEFTPPLRFQLSNETAPPATDRSLETRYYHDALGNLLRKVENLNTVDSRTTDFNYDTLGRLVVTSLPGYYDPATGRVEKANATGRFRQETRITYDALGNAVRTMTRSSAEVYQTEYKTYDTLGRLVQDVDALRNVTAYAYTTFGEQRSVTRHSIAVTGAPQNNGRDSYWLPDQIAAQMANDTQARTITMSYDNLGRKTEVLQPSASSYFFSGTGRTPNVGSIGVTVAQSVTRYEYNSFGEVHRERVRINDRPLQDGHYGSDWQDTWRYHDVMGREVRTVLEFEGPFSPGLSGAGYHTERSFDAFGNLVRQTEYAGLGISGTSGVFTPPAPPPAQGDDRITSYEFDALNRQTTVMRNGLRYMQWNGSSYVEVVRGRDEADYVQILQYDRLGHVVRQSNGSGHSTTISYDAAGQVVRTTEASRFVAVAGAVDPFASAQQIQVDPATTLTRDAFGNVVTTVRDPGAGAGGVLTTRQRYDHAGNLVSSTDARGNVRERRVDYAGRVVRETQQVSITFNNPGAYGGNGQLGSSTHTIERRYSYDAKGRQATATDVYVDGGVARQSGQRTLYNAFGEAIEEQRVWGAASAAPEALMSARVATYSYDNAGRVASRTAGDGLTKYFYDLAGRLTRQEQRGNDSVVDGTDTRVTETGYDRLGRAVIQRLPWFDVSYEVGGGMASEGMTPIAEQTYDRWGNVLTRSTGGTVDNDTAAVNLAGVSTISYQYDDDNRVIAERLPQTEAVREDGTAYQAIVTHELRYDILGRAVIERERADNAGTGGDEAQLLRERRQYYDAAGQLTAQTDASGITTRYMYDAHGRRIATRNALGTVFVDSHDANGNVVAHGVLRQANGELYVSGAGGQPVVRWLQYHQYDQANRRYASADNVYDDGSYVVWNYTKHDERGLVRAVSQPGNDYWLTTTEYDVLGNKYTETTDGFTKVWGYATVDAYGNALNDYTVGRLSWSKEKGALALSYVYNDFGQIAQQRILNSVTPIRSYTYHANGLLRQLQTDVSAGTPGSEGGSDYIRVQELSSYGYNAKGERVLESLNRSGELDWGEPLDTIAKTTYTRYDERGRMSRVWTPPGLAGTSEIQTLDYRYDELGNVRNIHALYQRDGSATSELSDEWFTYDAEGRVTRDSGRLAGGGIVDGTEVTYDALGRRATSYRFDRAGITETVAAVGDGDGFDKNIYTFDAWRQQRYGYDDLSQLKSIEERVIHANMTVQLVDTDRYWIGGVPFDETTYGTIYGITGTHVGEYRTIEQRVTSTRGEVIEKHVWSLADTQHYGNGTLGPETATWSTYFPSGNLYSNLIKGKTDTGAGYEVQQHYDYHLDGVIEGYTYSYSVNGQPVMFNRFAYSYYAGNDPATGVGYATRLEGGVVQTTGSANTEVSRSTTAYDGLGRVIRKTEHYPGGTSSGDEKTTLRTFGYDSQDRVIVETEDYTDVQAGSNTSGLREHFYANNRQVAMIGSGRLDGHEFSFGFTPISAQYPASGPSSYVVNSGDTLARIALAVWGDGSLWYLIADANSLAYGPDSALPSTEVGRSYRIPSVVTSRQSADTFQPYNTARIIGNSSPTPTMPVPPAAQCISDTQLLSVALVVAVSTVFTIATAGAASAALPAVLGGVLKGAIAGGIGAAAGSVAGQVAANATGLRDGFSAEEMGLAALTGAAGGAVGGITVDNPNLAFRVMKSQLGVLATGAVDMMAQGGSAPSLLEFAAAAAGAIGGANAGAVSSRALPMAASAVSGDWNRLAVRAVSALSSAAVETGLDWVSDHYARSVQTAQQRMAAANASRQEADREMGYQRRMARLAELNEQGIFVAGQGLMQPGDDAPVTQMEQLAQALAGAKVDRSWRSPLDGRAPRRGGGDPFLIQGGGGLIHDEPIEGIDPEVIKSLNSQPSGFTGSREAVRGSDGRLYIQKALPLPVPGADPVYAWTPFINDDITPRDSDPAQVCVAGDAELACTSDELRQAGEEAAAEVDALKLRAEVAAIKLRNDPVFQRAVAARQASRPNGPTWQSWDEEVQRLVKKHDPSLTGELVGDLITPVVEEGGAIQLPEAPQLPGFEDWLQPKDVTAYKLDDATGRVQIGNAHSFKGVPNGVDVVSLVKNAAADGVEGVVVGVYPQNARQLAMLRDVLSQTENVGVSILDLRDARASQAFALMQGAASEGGKAKIATIAAFAGSAPQHVLDGACSPQVQSLPAEHYVSPARGAKGVFTTDPDRAGRYGSMSALQILAGASSVYQGLREDNSWLSAAGIVGGTLQMLGGGAGIAATATQSLGWAKAAGKLSNIGDVVTWPVTVADVYRSQTALSERIRGYGDDTRTAAYDAAFTGYIDASKLIGIFYTPLALQAAVFQYGVKPMAEKATEIALPTFLGAIDEIYRPWRLF
jgi:YD repeat-containing protein